MKEAHLQKNLQRKFSDPELLYEKNRAIGLLIIYEQTKISLFLDCCRAAISQEIYFMSVAKRKSLKTS